MAARYRFDRKTGRIVPVDAPKPKPRRKRAKVEDKQAKVEDKQAKEA